MSDSTIDKIYGVLYYLITVKVIELLTKMFIEPRFNSMKISSKKRECLVLTGEVLEIMALLLILKGTYTIYNK